MALGGEPNLELRYFRLLFSGSATSLLFHTVGPRLSALVGSGNQITDVKAAHPVSPGLCYPAGRSCVPRETGTCCTYPDPSQVLSGSAQPRGNWHLILSSKGPALVLHPPLSLHVAGTPGWEAQQLIIPGCLCNQTAASQPATDTPKPMPLTDSPIQQLCKTW